MSRFDFKRSGAFRTSGGISEPESTSYGFCDVCGFTYQVTKLTIGLGLVFRPPNYQEIRARERAESDKAQKLFQDPRTRCVCDPASDVGHEPLPPSRGSKRNPTPFSDSSELSVGDRVRHAVFGPGTVQEIRGTGEKAEIVVRFDSRGVKNLSLAWAPLEKLPMQRNGTAEQLGEVNMPSSKPINSASLAQELNQLWELFSAGALTADQFDHAKKLLLGRTD